MEVFTLCRGELASRINHLLEMIHYSIIAINRRIGLHIRYEMRITIFMLSCSRYENDSLEVYLPFIPTRLLCRKPCCHRRSNLTTTGPTFARWPHSLLFLEVLHALSRSFDNNEIDSRTHLVTLWEEHITLSVIAYIILLFPSQVQSRNRMQKSYRIIGITDKRFFIKISNI